MNGLFQKPLFLFFIFILFFIILNFFVLPLLDNIEAYNGFFTMYIFWFIMIIFLFIISRKISKNERDEKNDV